MTIGILDFLKTIKPNELKAVKKLIVRDLDEIEKNKFLAYVDDGTESFDVQITLDVKKNIIAKTCDCGFNQNCAHQTALILFIASQKKITIKVKKPTKRKISETDVIIESIDSEAIKLWLSKILNSNKEIAFLFKTEFGQKNIIFDNQAVREIIAQSIQSVIGKRRKIETSEIKKVVDNLSIALNPVLEFLFEDTVNEEKFELLSTITEQLHQFELNYYFSSIRVTRFIENLYQSLLKSLFNIKDLEIWKQNVEFYFSIVFEKQAFRNFDFQLIKNIYSFSEINPLQREFVVQLTEHYFMTFHETFKKGNTLFNIDFDLFFLTVFTENERFENNSERFEPRRFQNNFNVLLIENLIKIKKLNLAENYCIEQISFNSNRSYDKPYTELLKTIYTLNGDVFKKISLLARHGDVDFDFDNYLLIRDNCPQADFKKYRQAVLTNAIYSIQDNDKKALDFYYKVLEQDGETQKVLGLLTKSGNLAFFNDYKEIALQLNPLEFVISICQLGLFSPKIELITTISNYIDLKLDKQLLQIYLKDRRVIHFGKMYEALIALLNK